MYVKTMKMNYYVEIFNQLLKTILPAKRRASDPVASPLSETNVRTFRMIGIIKVNFIAKAKINGSANFLSFFVRDSAILNKK